MVEKGDVIVRNKAILSKLFVFIIAMFMCLSAIVSCKDNTVKLEYDELSQNLVKIELVNITTESNTYTTNIEVIKTLEEDMHEAVLREIASMDFHIMLTSPQDLKGKGLIIYDDTFKLIITQTVICKVYLDDTSPELSQGEFYYEISAGESFDQLLEEISQND